MRLLIDTVPIGSPGMLQLRTELCSAIEQAMPAGQEAILLLGEGNGRIAAQATAASRDALEKIRVENMKDLESKTGDLEVFHIEKPDVGWLSRRRYYNETLPRLAREHSADVVYSMSGIVSRNLCRGFGTVSTINNMLPFTPRKVGGIELYSQKARMRNLVLNRYYVSSLKMADAIILHSTHALDSVSRYTGDISAKTQVALTGVPSDLSFDQSATVHPYNGQPYFLYFSAIRSYKNHLNLIRGYQEALNRHPEMPELLIAGMAQEGGYLNEVENLITEQNLQHKVKYLGVLERADILTWLYHAEGNFFPSLCENNSVVLAEILGTGSIMACSNIPPMSEVGSYAALQFDPFDTQAIGEAFATLGTSEEKKSELRELAKKRASELSWTECGDAIWRAAKMAFQAYDARKKSSSSAVMSV